MPPDLDTSGVNHGVHPDGTAYTDYLCRGALVPPGVPTADGNRVRSEIYGVALHIDAKPTLDDTERGAFFIDFNQKCRQFPTQLTPAAGRERKTEDVRTQLSARVGASVQACEYTHSDFDLLDRHPGLTSQDLTWEAGSVFGPNVVGIGLADDLSRRLHLVLSVEEQELITMKWLLQIHFDGKTAQGFTAAHPLRLPAGIASALATASSPVFPSQPAPATSTTVSPASPPGPGRGYVACPPGYACLYAATPQTGAAAYQGFYNYGTYNLVRVTGQRLFTNAQTGNARAYLCTGYGGTGSCELVPAGTTVTRDFGPINSVHLTR